MIDFLCVTTEGLARRTCGAAPELPEAGGAASRARPRPAHRQNGSFPRPALPQNAGGWVFDPPRARREVLLARNPVRLGGTFDTRGLSRQHFARKRGRLGAPCRPGRARISNMPPNRGPFWPLRAEAGAERPRGGQRPAPGMLTSGHRPRSKAGGEKNVLLAARLAHLPRARYSDSPAPSSDAEPPSSRRRITCSGLPALS